MGYLMRRNILVYKAPPLNEGYDLICIHPNPRHRPRKNEKPQVRIQVKSRYQSDAIRGFPVKKASINAFDFLIAVFLNVGEFQRGKDGTNGARAPEFYVIPQNLIRRWHDSRSSWQKVILQGHERALRNYKDEDGFERIAEILGIPKPSRGSR